MIRKRYALDLRVLNFIRTTQLWGLNDYPGDCGAVTLHHTVGLLWRVLLSVDVDDSLAITLAAPLIQRTGRQTYAAAKTPFNAQLARLDDTYQDYLDEGPTKKFWKA